jgi:hypothetical protein
VSDGPRGLVVSEAFVEYLERLRETWPVPEEDENSEYRAGNAGSDPEPLSS